jgi:acetoin utilization deacetylase AcuC-like enzyme
MAGGGSWIYMKIVYSDGFHLQFGDHVFPSVKYRETRDRLIAEEICTPSDLIEPDPARDEDIRLVHTEEYVSKLQRGSLSLQEIIQLEVPYSKELVDAFWLGAGGTVEASRRALSDRVCLTLCGGFHHAFADHGEGFCLLNDVATAVRVLQNAGMIETAMTVDCDVHHGNGTAHIFRDDPSVFTLSIHQLNNYPVSKPPSNLDIHLEDRTRDEEYLDELAHGLDMSLDAFNPDLIVYLAGGDPYRYDQLGGLALTLEGLRRRDLFVLEAARKRKIPIAVTLAGGYALSLDDTVAIHVNTVRAALDVFGS